MFTNRHFRDEAISDRCRDGRPDDLLRVTAPHEWAMLATLGLMLAACLAWSLLGSVDRVLMADCAVTEPGERHSVVAGVPGTVIEFSAGLGDRVEEGQVIARLYRPDFDFLVETVRNRLILEDTRSSGETIDDEFIRQLRSEVEVLADKGSPITSHVEGRISFIDLAVGQSVAAGMRVAEIQTVAEGPLHAIVMLSAEDAKHLDIGMKADIRIDFDDSRKPVRSKAFVSGLSERAATTPEWMTRAGVPEVSSGYQVQLALDTDPPPGSDSGLCKMRLVTKTLSPIRLLFSRWGE